MNVTLIGMGSGQPENLTLQGLAAPVSYTHLRAHET